MEEPPDIQKKSQRELMSELVLTIKQVRAKKAILSGMDFLKKDDWRHALEDFQEARELFEELGDQAQSSNMLSMEGLCLFALNELNEAAEVMRRAIALKDGHQLEGKASDLLGLGEVLLKIGDAKGALASFEEAACILKGIGLDQEMERAMKAADKAKKALGSC